MFLKNKEVFIMSNKNNVKNGFFKIENYGDKLTYGISVRPMIIDLFS